MKLLFAIFVFTLAFAANIFAGSPYVVVLVIGQDAGMPLRSADYLLIDGTFYADGEIGRPMSEVPRRGFGIAAAGQRIGL